MSLGGVLTTLGIPEGAAAALNGGTKCTAGSDCKTGKCLGSGKCSCSAAFSRCLPPTNPCKKATCNTGKNRCETTTKKNGVSCGEGKSCQGGICKTDETDNRTVQVFFGTPNMDPTDCFVKVFVTGFAPGTHSGSLDSNVGPVEFTVEVGGDGTGSWSSMSTWPIGNGVTATVDGVFRQDTR